MPDPQPTSEARDQTRNLTVPSEIHFHCTTTGTPKLPFYIDQKKKKKNHLCRKSERVAKKKKKNPLELLSDCSKVAGCRQSWMQDSIQSTDFLYTSNKQLEFEI